MTHPATPASARTAADPTTAADFSADGVATRLEEATSLAHLLLTTARAVPDQVALRLHETGEELSYAQVLTRAGAVAQALQAQGVRRGQPVALMLRNRPEFHVIDAAAMLLGAVPFSIYNTSAPEQIEFLLSNSGAEVVVAESGFLPSLEPAVRAVPSVCSLLLIDAEQTGPGADGSAGGEGASGAVATGSLVAELAADSTDFDFSVVDETGPDDLLTLIYTSGTTGDPKGVELTHRGMLTQLQGIHRMMPLPGQGRQVSLLPAAHVADRWTSHYSAFMTYANTVTCVMDMTAVGAAVAQTRPTLFGAVPRVWEKFKAALEARYEGDLMEAARKNPDVGAVLLSRMGLDEAAWAITGAAPTPPAVVEFFGALGLPLCEMLGMSEVSCGVAVNTPDAVRPGSVGRILDTVDVTIADDGEVLIGGPQVMRGYWGAPEKTRQAVDEAGVLATGDIGRIDDDGFLWIVDRKKEIIINAAGKNMSPTMIEMTVKSAGSLVEHIAVVGDGRRYNVALVVAEPGQAADMDADELERRVQQQIDRANASLARVEQIKTFRVLPEPWLPGRELTPTQKLRRHVIDDLYVQEIEALYA